MSILSQACDYEMLPANPCLGVKKKKPRISLGLWYNNHMATPATFDIYYYRGDTYTFIINAKDNDGSELSLTGWTAAFTIANYRGPTDVELGTRVAYDCDASIDGSQITCTIPPAIGLNLGGAVYVYDVQVTSPGGSVYTYLTGNIYTTLDISGAE